MHACHFFPFPSVTFRVRPGSKFISICLFNYLCQFDNSTNWRFTGACITAHLVIYAVLVKPVQARSYFLRHVRKRDILGFPIHTKLNFVKDHDIYSLDLIKFPGFFPMFILCPAANFDFFPINTNIDISAYS